MTGAATAAPGVALVTGASSGLGVELARSLARRRWHLVLTARRAEPMEHLAHELERAHGIGVRVVPLDLVRSDGPDRLADLVLAEGPPPALLVNNAGAGRFGAWLEADGVDDTDMLRLNVEAPTRLARRLVPAMAAQGGGRLLNVASVGAFVPGPKLAVYYATKAYLLSWSLALAEEWRGGALSVTCLCPGPMATAFQERAGFRTGSSVGAEGAPIEAVAEAGVRGVLAGRALVLPTLPDHVVAFAARVLPRSLLARLVHSLQRRRSMVAHEHDEPDLDDARP